MRVLQYSSLKNEIDKTFRLDAEHYRKKYQISISKLSNLTTQRLGSLLSIPVCTGHTPSMQNDSFYGGSVKFIKTDNVRENKITDFFTDYLSDKGASELKKSNLISGDVITTIIGATYDVVGRAAMVTDELLPANINQNIALIRCNSNKINPYFLNCYLNTYIGRAMLHYHSRQTEQVNLNCREVERVLVPIFNNEFQKSIEELYKKSEKIILDSKIAHQTAQNLLLEHLGLKDFNPPAQAVNIKSFADSFGTSGRLDAEFYQEKYEKLIDKIKSYPKGYNTLDYFIKNFSTGFAYKSETYTETGIPLIRINNIGNGTLDISNAMLIPQGDISLSPKDVANENDILVSMSGTIGNSCKVPKGVNAVVNQRIMRITPQNINVEVLPLIINSIIGKYQLERMGTGGVQTNISANDIKQIVIPNVEEKIQTQIADLIQQSDRLRQESQHLLEEAKFKVEQAIESCLF